MKKFLANLTIIVSLFSCGDSGSGGAPAPTGPNQIPTGYAATPQPCNTQNSNGYYPPNSYCNNYMNTYYNNWQTPQWGAAGAWYWPQTIPTSNCNGTCPAGYYPVYGVTFGVACAPMAYISFGVVFHQWGQQTPYGTPQNVRVGTGTQDYYSNFNQTSTYCSQSPAQGCDVRLNNCPSGSFCQAIGGGSTIGLCTK